MRGGFFALMREVQTERKRQEQLWGEQHHPNGTAANKEMIAIAKEAREITQLNVASNELTWRDILFEEVCEVFAEKYDGDVRRELVEVIAVSVAWIEDIDSRRGGTEHAS